MVEREHSEIMRSLGRLEGKTDAIISRLNGINGTLQSHDKRINETEADVASIKGKAAIIGSLFGAAAAIIGGFLREKLKL